MENFTPITALVGGALIGSGALLLMATLGRIAGISGIVSQALFNRDQQYWRVAFIAGLLLGPLLVAAVVSDFSYTTPEFDAMTLLAGLLVGVGTALGSGCTSGHGICGIGRFSPRSLLATLTFMVIGMLVATLWHA